MCKHCRPKTVINLQAVELSISQGAQWCIDYCEDIICRNVSIQTMQLIIFIVSSGG